MRTAPALKLWIYDLRTNKHFTLKENPLKRSDLDDFVASYNPRTATHSTGSVQALPKKVQAIQLRPVLGEPI
jgi:hypothetical protein